MTIVNPNAVLDRLKTTLDAALVPALLNGGYDYRTQPALWDKYYVIAFMGQMPMPFTAEVGSLTGFQNIGLAVFVKHDKTPEGIRAAERSLNDIEHATIEALDGSRDQPEYYKIVFPFVSARPRAPLESPEVRIAEVPFRVVLK